MWKYWGNELSWRPNDCSQTSVSIFTLPTHLCFNSYNVSTNFQNMKHFVFESWNFLRKFLTIKNWDICKEKPFSSNGFLICSLLDWACWLFDLIALFSLSVHFVIRCFYYPWSEAAVFLLSRLYINIIFFWNFGKNLQYHIPSRSNQYKRAARKMACHRNV